MYPCVICGKRTNAFNYGVNCCNACKMFYKRSIIAPTFPTRCKNGGNCSVCRYCRFQRCLQAGMNPPGPPILENPRLPTPDVSLVIQNLDRMNISRETTFLNFVVAENMNLDVLILSRKPNYLKKPENLQQNCYSWSEANINTSIDFVKKFDVIHELSNQDEVLSFVKQSYLHISLLYTAMGSYQKHREAAEFPGGIDVISEEFRSFFEGCPAVLNKIRCPLVEKLRELTISNEEFLLLSALIALNPASSTLSDDSRTLIGKHQTIYSSTLLQYCQNNYQQSGPSRFSALLGVCYTISQLFEDFKNALAQFQLSLPQLENKKILQDFMDSATM